MIRSLRGKLASFNMAVTGVIILIMTLLSLVLYEGNTWAETQRSFNGFFDTVTAYLQREDDLSADWLHQLEQAGDAVISIRDGGKPLYSLRGADEKAPVEAARDYAYEHFALYPGSRCSFRIGNRMVGMTVLEKEQSKLELLVLYSLEGMERGILRLRIAAGAAVAVALGILWGFSWCFTGRMLRPIQENQTRQYEFTAAASHELRTPLAAILSAASAMEQAGSEERGRFLGHIQREGGRMKRLIDDLLTLSRGDSQNWQICRENTEPDMLLLEAYETFAPRAKELGMHLEIDIPQAQVPRAMLDRERMQQVLAILLDNALSYTPSPGTIRLSLQTGKRCIRFSVSDSGHGVLPEMRQEIFQRFHRGERSRSDKNHYGLGLAIAQQIVRGHRGKIWVKDGPLGGAEFLVELPLS